MSPKKKFIIITSIFPPTDSVRKFAELDDWQLVVVGDKKTPVDWQYKDVIYLGPEDQENLNFAITKLLPWNHYCRKMVGYLYAIKQGAEIIFDTDDDNEPKPGWPSIPEGNHLKTLSGDSFVNIYDYFTKEFVWPRGYPLQRILSKSNAASANTETNVGIWQFLADEDPDVDAIYRLTNNKPIYFDDNEPVVLAENTVCPFNSQNTAFKKELFPLLYLPAFVTFRFTDILRGLVAQPVLWKNNYQLGFGPATVIQKRNPHDYMRDFESEIPVYLHAEKVIEIAKVAIAKAPENIADQIANIYAGLEPEGIVSDKEVALLNAWLQDIKSLQKST